MTGTVRMTVESEAPMAMLTTDCMRLASAARKAVRISGAAEIAATTTAINAGGALEPFSPAPSSTDITSASAPISTTPITMTRIESVAGSLSSGALLAMPSFRSVRG